MTETKRTRKTVEEMSAEARTRVRSLGAARKRKHYHSHLPRRDAIAQRDGFENWNASQTAYASGGWRMVKVNEV